MGKFTAYKLPLKSMPKGAQMVSYHLSKQFFVDMESADIHDADLNVDLAITHKDDYYDLTFHITGTVTLICDRCLDDLIYPIDATYHIVVKYGDDYNDEADDLLVIPESDNYLNVAYMIYDTVALAIPMKHVHPLGKCNRQMSAMLKKHRARKADDADSELEEELIDEIDNIDQASEGATDADLPENTDPRWDALKNLKQSEE